MALFASEAKTTFVGIALVVIAVIFLLSGLDIIRVGALRSGQYLVSSGADVVIAFILIAIGLAYVYSEAGKPK
jgi:hypothetical protein